MKVFFALLSLILTVPAHRAHATDIQPLLARHLYLIQNYEPYGQTDHAIPGEISREVNELERTSKEAYVKKLVSTCIDGHKTPVIARDALKLMTFLSIESQHLFDSYTTEIVALLGKENLSRLPKQNAYIAVSNDAAFLMGKKIGNILYLIGEPSVDAMIKGLASKDELKINVLLRVVGLFADDKAQFVERFRPALEAIAKSGSNETLGHLAEYSLIRMEEKPDPVDLDSSINIFDSLVQLIGLRADSTQLNFAASRWAQSASENDVALLNRHMIQVFQDSRISRRSEILTAMSQFAQTLKHRMDPVADFLIAFYQTHPAERYEAASFERLLHLMERIEPVLRLSVQAERGKSGVDEQFIEFSEGGTVAYDHLKNLGASLGIEAIPILEKGLLSSNPRVVAWSARGLSDVVGQIPAQFRYLAFSHVIDPMLKGLQINDSPIERPWITEVLFLLYKSHPSDPRFTPELLEVIIPKIVRDYHNIESEESRNFLKKTIMAAMGAIGARAQAPFIPLSAKDIEKIIQHSKPSCAALLTSD